MNIKERFAEKFVADGKSFYTIDDYLAFFHKELLALAEEIETEAIAEPDYERGNAIVGAAKLIRSKANLLQ